MVGAQPAAALGMQVVAVAVQIMETTGTLGPLPGGLPGEARLNETIDELVGVELPGPQRLRTRL